MRACVMSWQPIAKSKTRRVKLIRNAKSASARAVDMLTHDWLASLPEHDRDVKIAGQLAAAIAELEAALYLQTGGAFGSLDSTANDVIRRQRNVEPIAATKLNRS